MDISTIIGIVACLVFIIISIAIGQDGIAGIKYFLDAPSAMITFGGAFACIFAGASIKDFLNGNSEIILHKLEDEMKRLNLIEH